MTGPRTAIRLQLLKNRETESLAWLHNDERATALAADRQHLGLIYIEPLKDSLVITDGCHRFLIHCFDYIARAQIFAPAPAVDLRHNDAADAWRHA